MNTAPPTLKTIFVVYFTLLLVLALAAVAAFMPAGPWKLPVAMLLGAIKMTVIFLYFMGLRYQRGLIRVFAVAAFFWLAIICSLTFADYLTRNWLF